MTPDERYARLRAAVLAYNRALQAYGLAGSQWVDDSPTLDALYKAMLTAADIDYPGRPNTTQAGPTGEHAP